MKLGMARRLVRFLPLLVTMGLLELGFTWLGDDAGRLGGCMYLNEAGLPTICSSADPLPMAPAGLRTTDPAAWGKQYVTSPGATASGSDVALFDGNGVITRLQVANAGPQNATIFRSYDSGRSWVNAGATTGAPFGARVRGFLKIGPLYVVAHETGVTTSVDLVNWIAATGLTGIHNNLGLQGGTVVVHEITGPKLCRSPNITQVSPPPFTCATPAGLNVTSGNLSITSPAAGTWLFIDGGGGAATRNIFRSTDDGISWTLITALSAGGNTQNINQGVTCISPTICLAAAGHLIHRSTDAGLTWTQIAGQAGSPNGFQGFLNFGNGIVTALTLDLSNGTSSPYRTADFGASWSPNGQLIGTTGSCQVGLSEAFTTAVSFNGIGFAICLGNNAGTEYSSFFLSPPAGTPRFTLAGEQLVGGTGTPGNPSAAVLTVQGIVGGTAQPVNGTVTANQGAAAASPAAWPSVQVQGATLFNSQTTGAANTAVPITIAAVAGLRANLYRVEASCSAGTATITVTDGGTTVWSTLATEVGTARFRQPFAPTALASSTNSAMVITLSTCGVGNTGTLIVHADRF